MWIPLTEVDKKPRILIAPSDPAVDQDAFTAELAAKYTARRDHALVPLKPEQEPVHFYCRALSDAEFDRVLRDAAAAGGAGTEVLLGCFDRGCSRVVAGLYDGTKHFRGDLPRDKWARIPPQMRLEIGAMVQQMSTPADAPEPSRDVGK